MKSSKMCWLLLVGLGAVASAVFAQTPGGFTATGNMTTPRMGHTATLLSNGKVLIAGGWQSVPGAQNCTGQLHVRGYFLECVKLLASAELYDPLTGTFAPTGNMTTTHLVHTATLLPDGRVLIDWGTTAELYDPSTGTFNAIEAWRPGGPAVRPRYLPMVGFCSLVLPPSSTTLLQARSLLPGRTPGLVEAWSLPLCFQTAESWSSGAPGVAIPRGGPNCMILALTGSAFPIFTRSESSITANLLANGTVLVAGGDFVGGDDTVPIQAGDYDPSTGTFTAIGSMTAPRRDQTATLLPDGSVLIAGGDAVGTSAELYTTLSGTFSSTGSMGTPRFLHSATLLPDGRVLMTGGLPYSTTTTATAELYTPPLLQAAPVLLSLSGDGNGQGAIQHANTTRIASAADPATAGEYLSIYLTGLADGSMIPPQVALGGRLAEITFFGNVPGYPGLNVVNMRMPKGVAPGDAISMRLTYLGRPSNAVTIGVR